MIEANRLKERCLGIEIRHGGMSGVIVDPGGSVVGRRDQETTDDQLVASIIDFVRSMARDFVGISRVGIAIPGLVDQASGRVPYSASFESLSNTDLADEVSSATNVPVILENDANAAATGEYLLGAGRGAKNMFYATLGDGVGGAFIFDGRLWHGAAGFAGEFGYLTLNSEGIRLEDVASTGNILRRTRSRFRQDSTSSLNMLDGSNITLDSILKAAKKKDDFSQMMLERTGTYVGTGVAAVINLLNVERIVIGGAIMAARDLVLNGIKRRARELSFAPAYESTVIVEGELGPDAAAIGAAVSAGIQCDQG